MTIPVSMTPDLANEVDVFAGSRLRAIRQSQGLGLQKLAEQVGVTYQQIQKYETGYNRMSATTLWRIAGILKVEIRTFFPASDPDDAERGYPVPGTDPEILRAADKIAVLDPKVRTAVLRLLDAL